MRAEEIMKTDVHSCSEDTTVRACARMMREHDIGFVPVCDLTGRITGCITDRDIALRCVAEGRDLDIPIRECMTREIIACRPYHDLSKVENLMGHAQKSRLMVLDDDGVCVGVISLSDLGRVEEPQRMSRVFREITQREVHI